LLGLILSTNYISWNYSKGCKSSYKPRQHQTPLLRRSFPLVVFRKRKEGKRKGSTMMKTRYNTIARGALAGFPSLTI
jgi:hypothetical protein